MSRIETYKCVTEQCPLEASINISSAILENDDMQPHPDTLHLMTALKQAREQIHCHYTAELNANGNKTCPLEEIATRAVRLTQLGVLQQREDQLQQSQDTESDEQPGSYL